MMDIEHKFQVAYGFLSPTDRASLHKVMPHESPADRLSDKEAASLLKQVQGKIEELEQLLKSGLDDSTLQKLTAILEKLRGALQGGSIPSHEVLAMALQEATTAMTTAEGEQQRQDVATLSKQQYWDQHREQQEMVDRLLDEGVKKGYLDKETRKELAQEEQAINQEVERIAQMPEGEEKEKANASLLRKMGAYYHHSIDAMKEARAKALANGDTQYSKMADEAIKEQETLNKGLQAKGCANAAKDKAIGDDSIVSDWGEEPKTTSANVTHNDIEIPKAGKKTGSKSIS